MNASADVDLGLAAKDPRCMRRWTATSLWLLVAILSLAVARAGVRAYRQHAAVIAIEHAGGEIEIDLFGPKWAAQWVARFDLAGFGRVTAVRLIQVTSGDAIALLDGVDDVEELYINGSELSPRNLDRIGSLRNLRLLSIFGPLTGQRLADFPPLLRLEFLVFETDGLADDGVAALRRFPLLQELWLDGKVTVANLESIAELSNLRELRVDRTGLSHFELTRFAADHPNLNVNFKIQDGGCRWPVRYTYRGQPL
jgi:hypothetical protein